MSYLRFRYILVPSISCMYSNPASRSSVASLMLVAVLTVHSSSLRSSRCMYFCVVVSFLCPIWVMV